MIDDPELKKAKRVFEELAPSVCSNRKFTTTWFLSDDGVYFPSISLTDSHGSFGVSFQALDILKRSHNRFQLIMTGGMFILLGEDSTVPATCLPRLVSEAELDSVILSVLESWIRISAAMKQSTEEALRLNGELVLPL